MKLTHLLLLGEFEFHNGGRSDYKIDADALTDDAVRAAARLIARLVGEFSEVEGVATGGDRIAQALKPYRSGQGPLLIVDDVCTTGGSMEEQRNGRSGVKGAVIFARGPIPSWAVALFVQSHRCPGCGDVDEDVTYQPDDLLPDVQWHEHCYVEQTRPRG